LYLAGGLCPDFYPWDLALEEGFSRLYRAELTVISAEKHAMSELAGLLDKGVTLVIGQKLEDTTICRTRYLHGIVTGVKSAGIFVSGQSGLSDSFSYVLTIEPELARLKFTRFTAPYYRSNPLDIFSAILTKYHITPHFIESYIDKSIYGTGLLFDQSGVSDLDFIKSLAELYGVSFTFTHSPVSSGQALGVAGLYFSDGTIFPRSPLTYSDDRGEPQTVSFDFMSAIEAQNVWKMGSWSMGQTIGVDGISLNASYPNANYGSSRWRKGEIAQGDRHLVYNHLFHGYDRQVEEEGVNDDIDVILDVREQIANQGKSRWTGGASNLALRPALILELKHFYGPGDDDVLTALVTGITLHHRVLWPANMAIRPEGADDEITEVLADCMDWGNDSAQWYCPGEKPI
jgi:uncharacterized protein involved in type VI secretion and phage assembly